MSQSLLTPAELLAPDIRSLRDLMSQAGKRIEIASEEHGTLVLMTKTELESLESALELMADADHMRDICSQIARACDHCNQAAS